MNDDPFGWPVTLGDPRHNLGDALVGDVFRCAKPGGDFSPWYKLETIPTLHDGIWTAALVGYGVTTFPAEWRFDIWTDIPDDAVTCVNCGTDNYVINVAPLDAEQRIAELEAERDQLIEAVETLTRQARLEA